MPVGLGVQATAVQMARGIQNAALVSAPALEAANGLTCRRATVGDDDVVFIAGKVDWWPRWNSCGRYVGGLAGQYEDTECKVKAAMKIGD